MKAPKHAASQLEFQLARFSAFTDGVFSISITLLVIEIKVPVLTENTDPTLLTHLSHTFLKFVGFLISFAVIGHYWIVHHRIFGYVKKYDHSLLWINLLFLLSVVLLPFSSGLLGEFATDTNMKVPYIVYVANICFVGFMNYWMWKYVSNPRYQLLTHQISPARIKLGVYRSLFLPMVFVFSLVVSFISPIISRFIPFIIPFVLHYGMKPLERMADKQEEPLPQEL
jgi:uncharacterized membrane protein